MADGLLTSGLNWIDQQKQALKARFGLLADNPEEFARQLAAEQRQRAGVGLIGEPKTAEEMASGAWINTPYGRQAMEAGSGFAGTTIGKNAIAAAKETLNKPRMGVWQGEKPLDMWKAEQQARMEAELREKGKQNFLEPSKIKGRVYHGTTSTDVARPEDAIAEFRGKRTWFSSNPEYANIYAGPETESHGIGGYVLPLNVQLTNPKIFPATSEGFAEWGKNSKSDRALKTEGYDGVIFLDKDGNLRTGYVFDPTQVKSAIGNIGTYDITNPNILAAGVPLGLLAGTNVEMPKKQEKKSMTPKR